MFLTIIIYLLTDDLHNKDDKREVALFIIFSKIIVYENFIYIYIYILVILFVTLLTIIIYLLTDDLHNKDDK